MYPTESNNVVHEMLKAFNERQFARIGKSFYHPDMVYTQNGRTGDLDTLLKDVDNCIVTFPDARFATESQEINEGRLVTQLTFTGTQLGAMGEIPPSGNPVRFNITISCRLEDGLIIEQVEQFDEMSVMQQLGLLPAK
jgi:predicted ester cyclase